MKELSIEQKAKAYDKAHEKIAVRFGTNVAEEIFSEFEESEDEKIRKELLSFCQNRADNYSNDPKYANISNWIAWLENIPYTIDHEKREGFHLGYKAGLEKQGEHNDSDFKDYNSIDPHFGKSIDKIESKFHKGDWVVVSTTEGDRVVQIASVEYFKEGGYPSYITTEGRWFGNGTKARLLTDKDVETITLPESKVIVHQKPTEWSEEDEEHVDSLLKRLDGLCRNEFERTRFAISEDRDWLKSLRQRIGG